MSVLCGWASIGETGNGRNNKAGDQTGREVKVGAWYDFGQTSVYRWKDRDLAKKYAKIIKAFCNNNHIGYDMNDRTTLYNILEHHKWDYKSVKKNCECDCSQLVACAVNCTVGKAVVPDSMYTGNLNRCLMNTGYFTRLDGSKYTDGSAYLMTGDIINAPSHHVISALENGSKATESKPSKTSSSTKKKKSNETIAKEVMAGKWGNGADRIKKLKQAGYNPTEIQREVNKLSKAKTIKVGSKVKIKNHAHQYGKTKGFASFVYKDTFKVLEIHGSRVVIADSKGSVIGAVAKSDCILQ